MKPHTPEELEVDGKDLPQEGMMFLGDKGKILAGFRNRQPALIPESRMKTYMAGKVIPQEPRDRSDDVWIDAFTGKETITGKFSACRSDMGTDQPGSGCTSCEEKGALRFSTAMKITNVPEANKFLTREYRKGWEL